MEYFVVVVIGALLDFWWDGKIVLFIWTFLNIWW
jgi:hypothetical protein